MIVVDAQMSLQTRRVALPISVEEYRYGQRYLQYRKNTEETNEGEGTVVVVMAFVCHDQVSSLW